MPARRDPASPRGVPFFDNARLALISIVALEHGIRLFLYDSPAMRGLYTWAVVFLMPAFAAIAGHLATPRAAPGRTLLRLGVPYVTFEVLYASLMAATGRAARPAVTLWEPTWLMWFILALLVWRLALPVVLRLRAPLAWAVAAGCAIGALPVAIYELTLTRLVTLFPFFVAGHLLPRRAFDALASPRARSAAPAVLGAAGVVVALWGDGGLQGWLHGTQPYRALGVSPAAGVGLRLLYYLGAGAAAAAILALVPRGSGRLTPLGRRTLYPYLLHGLVLLPLAGVVPASWTGSAPLALAVIGGSLAMGPALATGRAVRLARPLVEPRWAQRLIRSPLRARPAPRAAPPPPATS